MRNFLNAFILLILCAGCKTMNESIKSPPVTQQDQNYDHSSSRTQSSPNYGYQPLDPLSVDVTVDSSQEKNISYNNRILNSLPDETMRLAIGQIDASANISFGPVKGGYKGQSYIVILDYIKSQTYPFPIRVPKDQQIQGDSTVFFASSNDSADTYIPVYVGVGLRLTASVTIDSGYVELSNLFSIGAAAEAKRLNGTMVIQTLGVSGEGVSSALPIPTQINTTTIQNALVAIGAIRSKLYQSNTRVTPRIVGFYNNVGNGKNSMNYFISTFLNHKANLIHMVK
ncbi:MAG TPA: hypothetical protein PLP23_16435 [Panacibacter sp.]|nr:hypothetical protein [Panacibacter sp.]